MWVRMAYLQFSRIKMAWFKLSQRSYDFQNHLHHIFSQCIHITISFDIHARPLFFLLWKQNDQNPQKESSNAATMTYLSAHDRSGCICRRRGAVLAQSRDGLGVQPVSQAHLESMIDVAVEATRLHGATCWTSFQGAPTLSLSCLTWPGLLLRMWLVRLRLRGWLSSSSSTEGKWQMLRVGGGRE
jgi:hypothetical protein